MPNIKRIVVDFDNQELVLGNFDYPNVGENKPPIKIDITDTRHINTILEELFNFLGKDGIILDMQDDGMMKNLGEW